jgi:hypothetical protein
VVLPGENEEEEDEEEAKKKVEEAVKSKGKTFRATPNVSSSDPPKNVSSPDPFIFPTPLLKNVSSSDP